MTTSDALEAVCEDVVATYLRTRGHADASKAFETSSGRTAFTAETYKEVPRDLRTLIEQSASTAAAQAMARTSLGESTDDAVGALLQASDSPPVSYALKKTHEHLHTSNLLSIHTVQVPVYEDRAWKLVACLATTAADKRVVFFEAYSGEVHTILDKPAPSLPGLDGHNAAVLDLAQHPTHPRFVATAGMDGRVVVWDLTLQDHTRFAVRVVISPCGTYMASAGYDRKIHLYRAHVTADAASFERMHTITFATNPEALLFIQGPSNPSAHDTTRPWLVYTLRDMVLLHYLPFPAPDLPPDATDDFAMHEYNTNPDPDDFYAGYSLLAISLHPSGTYICAQTGDHAAARGQTMGGLNDTHARLILLPLFSSVRRLTLWTEAPSSTFSHPHHAWQHDGRAAWVTGEDGVLRLIALTGEIEARVLCHGLIHDPSLPATAQHALAAAGWTRGGNTVIKDVAVLPDGAVASCGFDRTVRIVAAEP